MDREFRLRPSGIIFYLSLVIMLILSKSGIDLIGTISTTTSANNHVSELIVALIGTGILLFTSDGIGYVFSTIVYAVFNIWGGYSRLFKEKLSYGDVPSEILRYYKDDGRKTGSLDSSIFDKRLREFSTESLLVYFFWYRDRHENPLDSWQIRRYTAFFTAWASIVAILTSQIIAVALICGLNLRYSCLNMSCQFILLMIIFGLKINADDAMRNALHAFDLWIAGAANPKFRKVLSKVHPIIKENKEATYRFMEVSRSEKKLGKE